MGRICFAAIAVALAGCPRGNASKTSVDATSESPPVATLAAAELEPDTSDLPGIRDRGQLRILVFAGEGRMLPRRGDPALLQKELAVAYARSLGVEPLVVPVERQADVFDLLLEGRGDLVAASIAITPERSERVAFTPRRRAVDEVLVIPTSTSATTLDGFEVHVRPSSSYFSSLQKRKEELQESFTLVEADETRTTIDLILDVADGVIPATAADRDILTAVRQFETRVEEGLVITAGQEVSWAVRPDNSKLQKSLNDYFIERSLTRRLDETSVADLAGIKDRGVLRVLTRNNSLSYFLYRGEPYGFEYSLAQLLADRLQVRLQMVVVPERSELVTWLLDGRGDVAAASLTVTPERKKLVSFSRPYLYTREVVVRPAGADGPTSPTDLAGREVHVRRSSSYWESLSELVESKVEVELVPVDEEIETEMLLDQVAAKQIPLTVADEHIFDVAIAQGVEIEIAFPLDGETPSAASEGAKDAAEGTVDADSEDSGIPIAFAMRPDNPDLLAEVDSWIEEVYRGRHYNILKRRYFGESRRTVERSKQRTSTTGRISPYDAIIKKYSERYGFDWRLMVAQCYVESQFDPKARSWVGAEGLFQVMPATGRSMGFTRLEDPNTGVHAGIKYMDRLVGRFDGQLPLSERIYFALAAYNAGLGHVYDAIRLADDLGLDPKVWFGNVEEAMLKLSEAKYARRARHGYCRGQQPVAYVRRIQDLYEAYVKVAEN